MYSTFVSSYAYYIKNSENKVQEDLKNTVNFEQMIYIW